MAGEITDQQLIDAGTDATNLALIINGPATGTGSSVQTRTGPAVSSVAKAIATVAATVPTHIRGAYSTTVTYAIGDMVTSNGSMYISLIAGNLNQPLTLATAWGLAAAAGAQGPGYTPAQVAAIQTKQPIGINLYNKATNTVGFLVSPTTGALIASAAQVATDFIVANSGGSMYTGAPTMGSSAGCAFYDGNFNYISGFNTVVAAQGNFACPANAVYVRLTFTINSLNALEAVAPVMVGFGTVYPTTAVAFGSYASNIIDQKDLKAISLAQAAVQASFPAIRNLFDVSTSQVGAWMLATHSVDATQTNFYVSNRMQVIAGRTYTLRTGTGTNTGANFGGSWFDANMNVILDVPCTPAFANLQQFVAPANAAYFIVTCIKILPGAILSPASQQMFVEGTVIPAAYMPFGASQPIPTPATYSTGNGRNVGMLGDSITAWFSNIWQQIVMTRTGCNQTFQDSRGGRQWAQALECYGTITPGTPYSSLMTYDPTRSIIDQANFAFFNTGRAPQISTVGNTLAQNIAGTDILLIALGTNDSSVTIGALGDAIGAGTLYGNMRWVVECYLQAKPTLRILGIGNEYRGDGPTLANQQAVNAAEKAFYQSYGIPYLDLFNNGGNAPFTNAVMALSDHIHPSNFNFTTAYGPAISNFLQQWL